MIVLLTDFGQSEYVGVMKGVIYSIHEKAVIVDLCHDISPQNLIEVSWILKCSHAYFPKGSTFCCVVDPGVGAERKALAVATDSSYFVAPDNGLLWETLRHQRLIEIRQIPVPKHASRTFHGRDVFAGAAANIDKGLFEAQGLPVAGMEKLELYRKGRRGTIVRIDRFGNVITNLPSLGKDEYRVEVEARKYTMKFYPSYYAAQDDTLFLTEGSNNTLEISLKNASANEILYVKTGARIAIS